jgi:methyl-accepting chemotaxis protein
MLVYTCLPILVIYGLLSYKEYRQDRELALEETKQRLQEITAHQASRLDGELRAIARMVELTARNLQRLGWGPDERTTGLLTDALSTNPQIHMQGVAYEPGLLADGPTAPFVSRRTGGGFKIHDRAGDGDYTILDWYLIPRLLKAPTWGDPHWDTGDAELMLCSYSSPFLQDGKMAGVVCADVSLRALRERVNALEIQGGRFALLSTTGTFLAHPDDAWIMRESIFSLAEFYDRPELAEHGRRMIRGETGSVRFLDFETGVPTWLVYAPVETNGWSFMAAVPEARIMDEVTASANERLRWSALALAVVMAIILGLALRIAGPMRRLAVVAGEVSKGDLRNAVRSLARVGLRTEKLGLDIRSGGDEIAHLVAAIAQMTHDLNSLVVQVQHAGQGFKESADRVSRQVNELEVTSTEQAASTNSVVTSAREIAATSRDLAQTMRDVSKETQDTETMAARGQEGLSEIRGTMAGLQATVDTMTGELSELQTKAENITSIITTIVRVADQTNLLSLNAAIQAEEAGEHGKGFGVVA